MSFLHFLVRLYYHADFSVVKKYAISTNGRERGSYGKKENEKLCNQQLSGVLGDGARHLRHGKHPQTVFGSAAHDGRDCQYRFYSVFDSGKTVRIVLGARCVSAVGIIFIFADDRTYRRGSGLEGNDNLLYGIVIHFCFNILYCFLQVDIWFYVVLIVVYGLIAGVICVRRKYLNLDEKNVHKMLNRN